MRATVGQYQKGKLNEDGMAVLGMEEMCFDCKRTEHLPNDCKSRNSCFRYEAKASITHQFTEDRISNKKTPQPDSFRAKTKYRHIYLISHDNQSACDLKKK